MNRSADVVVVRALRGLGDILCAVPSLRLIRTSLPEARIRFIGVEEAEPLLRRFGDYVDEFVPFPGYPGIPEKGAISGVAANGPADGGGRVVVDGPGAASDGDAHDPRPDLVLQLHGDGSVSNGFASSLRPRALAAHGAVITDPACTVSTRPYAHRGHEVERCLRVTDDGLRLIGITPAMGDTALEFRIGDAERKEADSLLADRGLADRRFLVLHPGSHLPDRRWPADRFAALAERLADRGVEVVVTGNSSERGLAEAVADGFGHNVSGRLSLGGLAALLCRSGGLITNDTGVSHLAAAVGAPSVVVFMASDPARWAPLDTSLHRTVVRPARPGGTPHAISPEGLALAVPTVAETYRAVHALGIA